MLDNFNTFSKIEDYLNGNLSEVERTAFEKELETNAELQTLVDDYSLVDTLIEQNELFSVNHTLTQIHQTTLRKAKLTRVLLMLGIGIILVAGAIYVSKLNKSQAQMAVAAETIKGQSFLAEATPFKIIDSMSEVELSSTIEKSREMLNQTLEEPIKSTNSKEPKANEIPVLPKKDSTQKSKQIPLLPKKAESIPNKIKSKPTDTLKVRNAPCNLQLTKNEIETTSTCQEEKSGAITFKTKETDLLYSIDNQSSYSKNNQFGYLNEGRYFVSVKKDDCESEPLEIVIEGYQCNYVIEPSRLIFFEKTLEKFQDEPTVEVFIFNRNGILVYNKTILTSENFSWDGNSLTSQPMPMGSYSYLLKSGQKIAKGEITVIR